MSTLHSSVTYREMNEYSEMYWIDSSSVAKASTNSVRIRWLISLEITVEMNSNTRFACYAQTELIGTVRGKQDNIIIGWHVILIFDLYSTSFN